MILTILHCCNIHTAEVSIDCKELADISNGDVSFSSLEPGSVATYTCQEGYKNIGEKNQTCNFLGKWSGQEPQCSKSGILIYKVFIRCPLMPFVLGIVLLVYVCLL